MPAAQREKRNNAAARSTQKIHTEPRSDYRFISPRCNNNSNSVSATNSRTHRWLFPRPRGRPQRGRAPEPPRASRPGPFPPELQRPSAREQRWNERQGRALRGCRMDIAWVIVAEVLWYGGDLALPATGTRTTNDFAIARGVLWQVEGAKTGGEEGVGRLRSTPWGSKAEGHGFGAFVTRTVTSTGRRDQRANGSEHPKRISRSNQQYGSNYHQNVSLCLP